MATLIPAIGSCVSRMTSDENGFGKNLILGYRAEHLAEVCQRPILTPFYNKTLATKLAQIKEMKGLQDKVIRSVGQKRIPSEQYGAVLLDEGHDFKPEWFKLVVQMIHPDTNSLLVLYDDAQSIYNGPKKLRFTFSSVGVQAKGRTTILKLNYRNTAEILSVARAFADDLLSPNDTEEDQAPTVQPMSTGRHGPKPLLVKLPTLKDEVNFLATKLEEANKTGMPWNDMAIVYRHKGIGYKLVDALTRKGIPFQWQQDKNILTRRCMTA